MSRPWSKPHDLEREPLLIELDNGLWALDVGLPGQHPVGLVAAPPLDQELQLPDVVRGPDDALRVEASVETSRPLALSFLGFRLRGHAAAAARFLLIVLGHSSIGSTI